MQKITRFFLEKRNRFFRQKLPSLLQLGREKMEKGNSLPASFIRGGAFCSQEGLDSLSVFMDGGFSRLPAGVFLTDEPISIRDSGPFVFLLQGEFL